MTRRPALTLAIAVCALLGSCAVNRNDHGEAVLAQVRALEQLRLERTVAADVPSLRSMFSDKLIYCHSSSVCESGASLLGRLGSGELSYLKLEPVDLQLERVSGTVVLHGTLNMTVRSGGQTIVSGLRYLAVYENTSGRWQLRAYQSTRMP
jgi:hypothetical protein